ncbi:multidrug effflux MFS transporter [Bacillus sp. 03113]|uniref:multidrug effflux MFS transporter n=1 Tax=Bacillus sp. 03113 TaxID=2578211 RepID=UPI0011415E28|nr:multidrug effflux MFS transporter [Bacillus sp. 03113]
MNNSIESITSAASTPTRSNRLWMAIVLGILVAFAPLSIDMYLPALPNIAKDLHTTPSSVQLSLTLFLFGLSLGQLIAGPLSDVYGRRKPLLIGLIIYFIVSLFCAFSHSIWELIAFRFIQGLAGSAGIVIARAIVRDLYSGPELTKFFSMLSMVNGVAPILAPIIGAQLLRFAPWQGVFIVLSGIGLTMFFVVLFGLPDTLHKKLRSKGGIHQTMKTFSGLLLDRSFMAYALPQGLVFATMFAYISGSTFVLQNVYGASPQQFSLIFAINGMGIVIASQAAGRLANIVNINKLFVIGLLMASIGTILLFIMILLHLGLYAILPPLFFVVSSVGIVTTTGFSLAMENYGKSAGSAAALLGVLSLIFGGSVAPLVGLGGGMSALPMGIVMVIVGVSSMLVFKVLLPKNQSNDQKV